MYNPSGLVRSSEQHQNFISVPQCTVGHAICSSCHEKLPDKCHCCAIPSLQSLLHGRTCHWIHQSWSRSTTPHLTGTNRPGGRSWGACYLLTWWRCPLAVSASHWWIQVQMQAGIVMPWSVISGYSITTAHVALLLTGDYKANTLPCAPRWDRLLPDELQELVHSLPYVLPPSEKVCPSNGCI